MEFDAKRLLDIWEQNRLREEKEREHQAQKAERERIRSEELSNFRKLLRESERVFDAQRIRNYVNIIETNAINSNTLTNELSSWIGWAKAKADWYDPLISTKDEILGDASEID